MKPTGGDQKPESYEFKNIANDEFNTLFDFLKAKGLVIVKLNELNNKRKNGLGGAGRVKGASMFADMDMGSESDDDEDSGFDAKDVESDGGSPSEKGEWIHLVFNFPYIH